MDEKTPSRRAALKTGLGLLAATSTLAVATTARAQSAKADPSTVGYQLKPSNGQQCSTCASFVAPGSCLLVSGTIAPTAWCELYAPKG